MDLLFLFTTKCFDCVYFLFFGFASLLLLYFYASLNGCVLNVAKVAPPLGQARSNYHFSFSLRIFLVVFGFDKLWKYHCFLVVSRFCHQDIVLRVHSYMRRPSENTRHLPLLSLCKYFLSYRWHCRSNVTKRIFNCGIIYLFIIIYTFTFE